MLAKALVAKIKKSNDAFKRSETDDEIARQVDSPSLERFSQLLISCGAVCA